MNKHIFIILAFLSFISLQAQQLETYDVKEGETLTGIAQKFKVTSDQILEYNPDLSRKGNIKPQTIFIPVSQQTKTSYVNYKITAGETLWSISQSYGLTVQDIKDANPNLKQNDLKTGQNIQIPIRKLSTKSSKSVNQSVTNSQFKTLKHLVLPKETKYGIAKQYGIEVKDLEKANPSVKTLQPGQILNIKRKPVKEKDKEKIPNYVGFNYYKVPDNATFYSLTKDYDLSRKELEAVNPALKNLGLQQGMILKLPKKRSADMALSLFAEQSVDLKTKIKNYDKKYIDLFLPINLHKFDNDTINKQKRLADEKLSQISIDFYNGAKAAIDSVNALGLEVDLRLYDTQTNPDHLDKLFQEVNFNQTQAVIGPIIPPNYQMMTNKLKTQEIPVVSPFSIAKAFSKNTISTIPDQATKQKALITMLESIHEDENLLVVTDSADHKSQYRFKYSFPQSKIISVRENYVPQDSILKYLNNKKENWVISTSSDIGIVESTINHLHSLAEYEIKEKNEEGEEEVVEVKHFPIRLFTSNRKNFYEDEIDNSYLSEMHFIAIENSKILAVDKPTTFMKAFYSKYGYYPNKYCVRGYDLMYDLLLRLGFKSDLYRSLAIPGMANYNLNRFYYTDNAFLKGYQNDAYYFIEYKDNLQTVTINSLKSREKIKLEIPDLEEEGD
jgi:LysM repeat protein